MDEEGTSNKSKHPYSVFKWQYKKFCKTIVHPSHGLPEMIVNDEVPKIFHTFCQFCSHSVSALRSHYCCYNTSASSSKDLQSLFPLSPVMRYSKDGFTSPCTVLQSVDPSIPDSHFTIKLKCVRVLQVSPEYVSHPADPDIAAIPSTVPDFQRDVNLLSANDLAFLVHPTDLDVDKKLWLYHHNNLNHLSWEDMYRLSKCGILPAQLQKFR